jgi:adenine C2-methylase RlmN of 23S rRNA A2503 and tRNA A37
MTDGIFQRPDGQQQTEKIIKGNNAPFPVTIRWSKGTDIDAGCGQLVISDNLMST